jgi:ketosteroid isomerase-like protein
MTEVTTQAILEQFFIVFNQHDVDAIMALMTDDCIFENTYPPPDGARYEGQAAVRAYWVKLFQSSPQAHFEIEELVALGDRGFIRWLYRWVNRSGQPGHVRGVDIFRLRQGKVMEKLSYVKG